MTEPTLLPTSQPGAEPDAPNPAELPAPPPVPPTAAGAGAPARTGRASRWMAIALVPVLAVGLFAGGAAADRAGWFGVPGSDPGAAAPSGSAADLALIGEAWRDLHDHYVDAKSLDDRALAYGAIQGMTTAIGDVGHTTFLTAEQAKAFEQSLAGSLVGVGITLSVNDAGSFVVNSVIPGAPAEEAGLRRGDMIVAVDGTSTKGETLDTIASRIRGPAGETVTLTIERAGAANFDVGIVRRKFEIPMVDWSMIPGRTVALIRLDQFNLGAAKAVQDAIGKAKAAGATALIFDLRGNGGGYATEAVSVASQFVGDGTVYRAIDATGDREGRPRGTGRPRDGHPPRRARRRWHRELRGDRHRGHPGREAGTGGGGEDLRHRDRDGALRPRRRLLAAHRRGALADSRRAGPSGTRASSPT